MLSSKKNLQITEGKILPNALRYTIPVILTNLLQVFYNSADMFVLGNYCENEYALGSVGCTSSLISLILSLFLGFSAAVSVTVSKAIGAKNKKLAQRTVHTAVLLALILGVAVTFIGITFTPTFLSWMGTQADYFDGAVKYMQIYFSGSVANLMYFFCSGILRAKGDTVRPLIFSSIGGACNVVLNLVFVLVFGMDVDGVAIATVAAQVIQATLTLIHMFRAKFDDPCKLKIKRLRFDMHIFSELVRVGIPLGLRSSAFGISNVIIQTGVNSLPPICVTANTAASNVETYIFNILNAFYHTTLTFTSQNYGARNFKRMKKTMYTLMATVTVIGIALGVVAVVFAEPLIAIFKNDPEVIEIGKIKLVYIAISYFLCGIMETLTAMLTSMGYAGLSTVVSLAGVCGLRIVWVYTVFQSIHTLQTLYLSYPISWSVTALILYIATLYFYKKKLSHFEEKQILEAK